jgi:hypothetical protein
VARNIDQTITIFHEQFVKSLDELKALGVIGGPISRIECTPRGGDRFLYVGGGGIGGDANYLASPGPNVVIGLAGCCAAHDAVDI